MHSGVTIKFNEEQQFRIDTNHAAVMTDQEARTWLVQEYEVFGCEPINPLGKVLAVDTVLSVAAAAGPKFFADPIWAAKFAKAALVALRRPEVRIDVAEMSVGY